VGHEFDLSFFFGFLGVEVGFFFVQRGVVCGPFFGLGGFPPFGWIRVSMTFEESEDIVSFSLRGSTFLESG